MPRPLASRGVDRRLLRRVAAVCTSLTALIATSLVAGPASAGPPLAAPCALTRTTAHHSEGVDTWNRAYPRPDRELRAVMIFLSFPDARPRVTPAELAADHFPHTSHFFERASYGRFRLRVDPLTSWVAMPSPSEAYGIKRDWEGDLRTAYLRDAVAAADARVDFSAYDIVYLVADPDAPGVDSDATKVVNFDRPLRADGAELRRIVTVFEQHPPDRNVLAHETGHVFDLPDLYHRPRDGKGDWDTHVGDWDLMGSQFGLAPEPFAWHKWKLGWLDGGQVVCANPSTATVGTLVPLGAPAGEGAGGARLLVVRTGEASVLAVEARGAEGNDASTCSEGVLVYRVHSGTASGGGPVEVLDGHPRTGACWETSVYPPLADAPLGVGERLSDPRSGVAIDVLRRDAEGHWTVRISRA
ncbi:M6 family metalloprotease domain-containing protein [Streptomyces sp. URMC 123]|uniref:M6 family metalloprotease domain-containing protein n=1 Tax=Streptomyces sp. URMC 123 TaxID=3423403 RepID=UPI003F1BA6EB